MRGSEVVVTPVDVALLEAIDRLRSVVAAAKDVGITRDRAVYRLARLRRRLGAPLVEAHRGGPAGGRTRLTRRGVAVVEGGAEAVAWPNGKKPPRHQGFTGRYAHEPEPHVTAPDGFSASVAFDAVDGENVRVLLDPESIVVVLGRPRSSARNAWPGVVQRVRVVPGSSGSGRRELLVRVGPHELAVAVTDRSVRSLGLSPGRKVTLLAKATALRRAGATPGSRPG